MGVRIGVLNHIGDNITSVAALQHARSGHCREKFYRSGLQHRLFLNGIDVRPDTYVDNCTVHNLWSTRTEFACRKEVTHGYIRSTDVYCTVHTPTAGKSTTGRRVG
jgi:hypothetical protein